MMNIVKSLPAVLLLTCAFTVNATETMPASDSCQSPILGVNTTASAFDFRVNGDVARDTRTGLSWKRCPLNFTFNESSGACSAVGSNATTFNVAGALTTFNKSEFETLRAEGWRIPSIKELGSIVNEACNDGILNRTVFPPPGTHYNILSSTVVPYSFIGGSTESDRGYLVSITGSRIQVSMTASNDAGKGVVYLVRDAQ